MSITPSAIDPRRASHPLQTPYAQIDPAEKLRKRVYTSFAASVGIVLVIAVGYIFARVFTQPRNQARSAVAAKITPKVALPVRAAQPLKVQTGPPVQTAPPIIKSQALAPPPRVAPPVVVTASAPAKAQPLPIPAPIPEKPISPPGLGQTWTTVTPRTGETYLQVMAMGRRFVEDYVNGLKGKGLHPLVAMSPLDGIYRILFGPFKDRQARDAERKDLEAAGLQPMVQLY